MAKFENQCQWLLLILFCCGLMSVVDGNEGLANNYLNLITNVRRLVSHPYRDTTRVLTGGREIHFVSLQPITNAITSVKLILSHRDLSIVGFYIYHKRHPVVVLFKDIYPSQDFLTFSNRVERLNFGGSYEELTKYANNTCQQVVVNALTLKTGIQLLEQLYPWDKWALNDEEERADILMEWEPDQKDAEERQLAEILLALAMIISEGARFTEIEASVKEAFVMDNDWRATCRHIDLMSSWSALSLFIAENTDDITGASTQYFPLLDQYVDLQEALNMTPVIQRCFSTPRQRLNKDNATLAQCRSVVAIDAALSDGPNNMYFFNGPNFANVHYTGGVYDHSIVGEVKSIFMDWPFLQGTEFVKGLDAAFHIPESSIAYIFRGNLCASIDLSNKTIISGPSPIYEGFPYLRDTSFVDGIDAAFHSVTENEVYMFRDDQYLRMHFEPGSSDNYVMNGPYSIYVYWSSLHGMIFENGFDSAYGEPGKPEAYLFDSDEYVFVNYAPGGHNDVLAGPRTITVRWPSFRMTAFDF